MKYIPFLFIIFSLNSFAEIISDKQIVQNIINESIANYSGNCPCPYNRASNGSSCGRRSAYSRAGGYTPICFPKDVSAEMIAVYKTKHGISK